MGAGVGRAGGCGGGHVDVEVGEAALLAFAGLVVLEPVEDVLALDLAVLAQHGGDALDLLRVGRPDAAAVVELLEYPDLLGRRRPPRADGAAHRCRRHAAAGSSSASATRSTTTAAADGTPARAHIGRHASDLDRRPALLSSCDLSDLWQGGGGGRVCLWPWLQCLGKGGGMRKGL